MSSTFVAIHGEPVEVIRYKGEPVATFKTVDRVHDRPDGTARRTFNENRSRFVEGEDFLILNQPDEIRSAGFARPQGGTPPSVVLLTRRGYLKVIKSFGDDRAWAVFDEMLDRYFAFEQPTAGDDQLSARLAAAEARIAALEEHRPRPRRALPATINLPVPDEEAARMLLDWIGRRGGEIAARDILRLGPNAVRDQVARDRAIAVLIGEGRLFEIGHRPRRLRLLS